ncbi:hypothetical protein EVAR_60253_1 [Eumeta japonica]|uniref:Uncharacterized protein n=1 Tax=Eumeta variegata TaxID=151549 RepID=A0A4C1ZDF2_EUMVA|nr:hypothetical protein EVAR_60253_1 [Eumeta japonica]
MDMKCDKDLRDGNAKLDNSAKAKYYRRAEHSYSALSEVMNRLGLGLKGPGGIMNLRTPQKPSIRVQSHYFRISDNLPYGPSCRRSTRHR